MHCDHACPLSRAPAFTTSSAGTAVYRTLDELRGRLAERQITLEVSEEARSFIAQRGFDPVYGARPLRRFIAREVETRIGRALLAGDVPEGAVIRVGRSQAELVVNYSER